MKRDLIKREQEQKRERALSLVKESNIVLLRNGIEIRLTNEELANLRVILANLSGHKFIDCIGDYENLVNTADISGIFSFEQIDAINRKKQGQWQDKDGDWYNRGDYECPICGSIIPKGMKCGVCAR